MRRAVFGLGAAHLAASAAVLALLIHWAAGLGASACAALGLGLALSSTAIVLPMLAERQLLDTAAGRDAFAVLLFQDLSFIPLVALVPLLAGHPHLPGHLAGHLPWRVVGAGAAGDRGRSCSAGWCCCRGCSACSAARVPRKCSPPPPC